ncbi:hypothetical protein [Gelidibacter gilvus]|nr:hypothetical protein [Gelidibacter gilvus]
MEDVAVNLKWLELKKQTENSERFGITTLNSLKKILYLAKREWKNGDRL